MRILFLASHFPRPNNSTMGPWALQQAQAFREAGNEVLVYSPVPFVPESIYQFLKKRPYCADSHSWDGLQVLYRRWPLYPTTMPRKLWHGNPLLFLKSAWPFLKKDLLKTVDEFNPDVVYAHHTDRSGFIANKLHELRGLPYLITDHSFGEITECNEYPSRKKYFQETLKGISNWIAVSKRMEADMKAIFPQIPSKTVYNGSKDVPLEMWDVPRPPEMQGKFIVLSVTFFYKRKNVPMLIDAFDIAVEGHPNVELRIIGDGDERPAVEAALAAAKHGNQIVLLGSKLHSEVLQEMVWADVFASVGKNEPFATVFGEAAGAKLPIIFGNDGGISDVFQDGVDGLGIDPDNKEEIVLALKKLIEDPELVASMSAASERVHDDIISWNKNAATFNEMFAEAVMKSKTNG